MRKMLCASPPSSIHVVDELMADVGVSGGGQTTRSCGQMSAISQAPGVLDQRHDRNDPKFQTTAWVLRLRAQLTRELVLSRCQIFRDGLDPVDTDQQRPIKGGRTRRSPCNVVRQIPISVDPFPLSRVFVNHANDGPKTIDRRT